MRCEKNDICAVIPIGGKGTRLRELTIDIPKPLFPINGESTLLRACKQLCNFGIKKIYITISYNHKQCIKHIEEIQKILSLEISTFVENEPLGECGSLWKIKEKLSKTIIFINGDLIFSVDFNKFFGFHQRINSDLTLATHTSSHPEDSDLVSAPNGIQIKSIYLKSDPNHSCIKAYLGNAGIGLIERILLDEIPQPENIKSSSLFHHLVKKAFDKNIRVFSYNTSEYIKDMGTPNRFRQIESDLKNNLVSVKNYKNKQKALFLDRDNTLIKCNEGQYILNENELTFLDSNIEKIAKYATKFNLVCIVTNQPQVSMGILSIDRLDLINVFLIKYCLDKGLKIDLVTFCPHHPHTGFDNEITFLKGDCFCRKPAPGMLFNQSYLRNIDLGKSLFIGDSWVDQSAAKLANCEFLNVKDL